MSLSTSGLGVSWRHETGLGPQVELFSWLYQGSTSFVDHLCFSVMCLLCFCVRLLGVGAGLLTLVCGV